MRIATLALTAVLASCAASGPPKDPDRPTVTARDFFVYSCLTAYMKANSVPLFDGSLAYAVEYADAEPEVLEQLYQAAKKVAASMPPPNYADTEHGSPAVLVRCQRESRSSTVEAILN